MSAPLGRLEVALFALAFAVIGLTALALAWSGPGAYGALARDHGFDEGAFLAPAGAGPERGYGLETRLDLHRGTLAYVLWESQELPDLPGGEPFYTAGEEHHLTDVRFVFAVARAAMVLALLAIVVRLPSILGRRAALRLTRDAAALSSGAVVVLAALAAVAFWPFFLAFHYIAFPQGNFLFDPATSNLVRLYPLEYWQGVTLRLLGSFVAISAAAALAAHVLLRYRNGGPRPAVAAA